MTDKMPDEIWVFPNAASIGDKGFTVTKPEDGYQKYTRADAAAILIAGLESIAANSCCDKCQEAKLVAQSTLDKYRADATKPEAVGVDGNTNDGYHTFNELYDHRHALFIALMKAHPGRSWKSKLHSDGSMMEGWFIAGIATTEGQATYHLPIALWDQTVANEMPMSPPWDGHTSADVIKRIGTLSAAPVVPDGWRLTEKQQIVWDWAASHGLTLLADDCNDLLWKLLLVEEK